MWTEMHFTPTIWTPFEKMNIKMPEMNILGKPFSHGLKMATIIHKCYADFIQPYLAKAIVWTRLRACKY